jgi:2'-5' RNA ligase
MRLFTAIDIPTDVKDHILALLNRLRPLAKISWSPVENLHITTKFIGEWPDPRLDEIKRALSAVSPAAAFDIEVRGLGWFPNPRHPRVFWVGVDGGQPLRALAHATEQAVAALGVPVEQRPYSPHLTLARIKDRVALEPLRTAVAEAEAKSFGTFHAPAFYLYLSAGGKYTKLAEFPTN